MTRTTVAKRANLDLIEDYYERWLKDPESVDQSWRNFFDGYELGRYLALPSTPDGDGQAPPQEAVKAVTRLVDAYREMGHYLADLDPLKLTPAAADARAARALRLRPRRGRPRPGLLQQARPAQSLHPARAARRSSARPTAGRSASSSCTSGTSRSATGCSSGWSRSGTARASTSRRSGGSSTS